MVNIKFVSLDFLKKKKQIWWFPYDAVLISLLKKSSILFHHSRRRYKLKTLISLIPFIKRIREESTLVNFIKSSPRYFRK